MKRYDYFQEFLASSIIHLIKNPQNFLKKLESGDINAIKMILDFIHKTAPKDAEDPKRSYSYKYEDLKYEEAFRNFKEDFIDKSK